MQNPQNILLTQRSNAYASFGTKHGLPAHLSFARALECLRTADPCQPCACRHNDADEPALQPIRGADLFHRDRLSECRHDAVRERRFQRLYCCMDQNCAPVRPARPSDRDTRDEKRGIYGSACRRGLRGTDAAAHGAGSACAERSTGVRR